MWVARGPTPSRIDLCILCAEWRRPNQEHSWPNGIGESGHRAPRWRYHDNPRRRCRQGLRRGRYLPLRVIGRRTGNSYYYARILWLSKARINLELDKSINGTTSTLKNVVLSTTVSAGDLLHVSFNLAGASPATLRAKWWKDGATEPSWQVTTTDSAAQISAGGGVGVSTFLASATTNAPVTTSIDNFLVLGPGAPPNQPPSAVFASSCDATGICSFDSSGSSDPDGTVASYGWDFGDAAHGSSTSANPSYTYGASGTYQVKLTVTDNKGATGSARIL